MQALREQRARTAAGAAKTRAARARAKAAAAAGLSPTQPHYDTGLRFDSVIRYAVVDPMVPPVPGTAKVKLELSTRTDPALAAFAEAIVTAMTDNPWLPTPVPSVAEYGAKLSEFEGMLSAPENLRVEAKNLTEQKDRVRKELEVLTTQRVTYVQMTSHGNADVIASSGMPICNAPTPVGCCRHRWGCGWR